MKLLEPTALILAIGVIQGCSLRKARTGDAGHHYFHRQEQKHAANWGYAGPSGPEHWGDLSPEYVLAKTGRQQSPVDISLSSTRREAAAALQFDYRPVSIDIVYNGHTVEQIEDVGCALRVGGASYPLKQFHFHAPSEHTVDGKHTAMEMHLVHKNEDGVVAVVAVMLQAGRENTAFEPVWNHLPTEVNKERKYEETIDAGKLLPAIRSYYNYMGSFTTPPCTEGVHWYVLANPVELSPAQIARFRAVISGNNRPTQPLNGREIVSTVAGVE